LDGFRRLDVDHVAGAEPHLDFRPKLGGVLVQSKRVENGALCGGGFCAPFMPHCPFLLGDP